MPTSSIFKDIIIIYREDAQILIQALERSEQEENEWNLQEDITYKHTD